MKDINISFICTSIRSQDILNEIFESIDGVCQENYEIVFCSEKLYEDKFKNDKVKYIHNPDIKESCPNYNECYNHTSGEWICIITDDLYLTKDPREFIAESRGSKNMLKNIFNIFIDTCMVNTRSSNPTSNWTDGCIDFCTPYVPCMSRYLIDEVLEGKIWNEEFIHHYPDVWLGLYMCTKYNTNMLDTYSCTQWHKDFTTNFTHDDFDRSVYQSLRSEIIANPESCTYNHSIDKK
tara:strand:+ start:2519 stop:3226 length:708 start_codon:yes stop_codon:yes gene_type:complete